MNLARVFSFKFAIVFIFLSCATFWDFRPMGERYFDIVALAIVVLFLLFNRQELFTFTKIEWAISLFIIAYCLYGYVTYEHRSSIVIGVLCVVFFVARKKIPQDLVLQGLCYIYYLNLIAFFIQFAVFHLTGDLLDFQKIFGAESRVGEEGYVFRPVGLYSEPHSFCVSIVMLTLMTQSQHKMRYLHYIGCFAMMVSLSLWGIIVAFALAGLVVTTYKRLLIDIIKTVTIVYMCLIGGFSILYGVLIENQDTFLVLSNRIHYMEKDNSLNDRFTKHLPSKEIENSLNEDKVENSKITYLAKNLFGNGISTSIFSNGTPVNAYAFIQKTSGLIGYIFFVFLIYLFFKSKSIYYVYYKISFIVIIALLATSYPMITYVFFWLFLILIIPQNKEFYED
jgi:hypothetical protein